MRHNKRWKRPRTQIRRRDIRRTLQQLVAGYRGDGITFDRVLDAMAWWRDAIGFDGETE